ncbi:hypothetical protein HYX14_05625 [Candidatus Woesearchaeota archaeon]|nr:hypothetical protein [Candidatus Woesearchaeota archaeon]
MNLFQRAGLYLGGLALGGLLASCRPALTESALERELYREELVTRLADAEGQPKPSKQELVKLSDEGQKDVLLTRKRYEHNAEKRLEDIDLEGLTAGEFEEYEKITTDAFELPSRIRNPQRYSLDLLEESNRNWSDPTYNKDKPMAVFVMAVYDYENKLGIRALEVETDKIDQFIPGYRVMLLEYVFPSRSMTGGVKFL